MIAARIAKLLDQPLLLAAVLVLLFVWGIWDAPLLNIDEGAFTEATREMIASGNYISIYSEGEPRHDKPILIYWAQAASVHLFGLNEFALRLPSVLAALFWALAIYRFAREVMDREGALVATWVMGLSLQVLLVAKGAIADSLLNLFLALSLLDVYRYFVDPRPVLRLRVFLWAGLAFLTKGPVAIFFPGLVSLALFASYGRWRDWLAAMLDWRAWLVFLAIVLPWHVAVYLDTGWAFFEGFYLHHNVGRYSDTMEGHGGGIFYYVLVAPLILLPFSGWLIATLGKLGEVKQHPLDRFLWLWFGIVLVTFSLSSTKLPHYLLYGATPLFLLLARYRDGLCNRWLAFVPAIFLLVILLSLTWVFPALAVSTERLYEQTLFKMGAQFFAVVYPWVVGAALVAALAIAFWRELAAWRGLVLVGVLQGVLLVTLVAPGLLEGMWGADRDAAAWVKADGRPVVLYAYRSPTFSVYREQVTERRKPKPGELMLTRVDKLDKVRRKIAPLTAKPVFEQGHVVILEVSDG